MNVAPAGAVAAAGSARPAAVQVVVDAGGVPLCGGALDSARAGVLAGVFKALGDPVRLRLLSMIASSADGEICVCDLSAAFPLTGPTISHHLRILREAGLVDGDRRGTWVYYRPVPDTLTLLAGLLNGGRRVTS